jgi:catechol 2,3-dioxygenase-like lactoylglutathione lyase family enzyme
VATLDAVMSFVSDVPRCARFYRDAFGFTWLPSEHPQEEWAVLDTGSSQLIFHGAYGPDGPIDHPTGVRTDLTSRAFP